MSYFAHMGSVWVKLGGQPLLMNDITAFATINKSWKDAIQYQINYQIKDGDMPHNISYRLYDTVEYWWTILLLNNIYDFDAQWPRGSEQLDQYIKSKYPNNNKSDVHHYIDSQGLIADLLSLKIELGLTNDDDVIYAANLEPISIEEYEMAVNEAKRNIKLIDPDFIGQVQLEFEKSMNPLET